MAENKYNHVYQDLRTRIENGELPGGEQLSEVKLSRHYGVARETLRKATGKLVEEGLLERFNGSGTRVCARHSRPQRFLVIAELNGSTALSWNALMPFMRHQADIMRVELELCDLRQYCWLTAGSAHDALKNMNISGILLMANHFIGNEPILKILHDVEIPVLLVFGTKADYQLTGWPAIGLDIRQGWRIGLSHLHACGHTGVITLTVPGSDIREYSENEYFELLRQIGLSDDPELLIRLKYDDPDMQDKLYARLTALFRKEHVPTAVMCHSDYYAMPVYEVLKRMELRIPDDVAVVGFISGLNCNFITPSLTSVAADFEELARQSLLLLRHAGQWFNPQHPELRPPYGFMKSRIVIRESSPLCKRNHHIRKEVQNV